MNVHNHIEDDVIDDNNLSNSLNELTTYTYIIAFIAFILGAAGSYLFFVLQN